MADSITLYPSGQVRAAQTIPGRKTLYGETKLTIDTADTVRDYKLTETAEDQGVALGFNEKYVLKDAIELSGTYDDDSEFDYRLPTTI